MLILIYYSDDHGFTPLLWSAREGQTTVFDLLLSRGARITALNDGGDNGLHLAASKGNKEIIQRVGIFNALLANSKTIRSHSQHVNNEQLSTIVI